MAPHLELVILGVGAGSTHVYHGECSSSFILCIDGTPLLMLDVGLGAVAAARSLVGSLPQHIYVSHNHTDHAGELPVLLAVESAAGRHKTVLAEGAVLDTLQQHRLAELRSTGRPFSSFADFQACAEGVLQHLPGGLALQTLRSRHAETCFGLLLHWHGQPVLGWTADSGYSDELYRALSAAPVVLLDGRATDASEHAGFATLQAAASGGVLGSAHCCVYGYGRVADAPASHSYPDLQVLKPGDRVTLPVCSQAVAPSVVQPGSQAGPIAGLAQALEASAAAAGLQGTVFNSLLPASTPQELTGLAVAADSQV